MKYNFVIFASPFDWYRTMYKEILDREDVRFYRDISDFLSPVELKLYKLHLSNKVNRVVSLPDKERWFRKVLSQIRFSDDKPICFIWYSHFMIEIKKGMMDYLKKALPDSKHVLYYTDAKNVTAEELALIAGKPDRIGVFDAGIAKQFQLDFWPNVYTAKPEKDKTEAYDLCFIGNDKGRQSILEEIADRCEANGIKTAFYLKTESPGRKSRNIHYLDSYMPYEEVVAIVQSSRCLLELRIEPYDTWSVRIQEAVVYNKKILTNNPRIESLPCGSRQEYVSFFKDTADIDWSFIKRKDTIDYHYDNEFSAVRFLENIQDTVQ